jgi:hypothetical protein
MAKREPLSTRFWRKVAMVYHPDGTLDYDACWLWQGNHTSSMYGYGQIRADAPSRRLLKAHRVAYDLWYPGAPLLPTQDACHQCDVILCCNPLHIHPGTHRENMRDYIRKYGRLGVEKRPPAPRPLFEAL